MSKFQSLITAFAVCVTLASQTERGQSMSTNPNMPSNVSLVVLGVTDLSRSIPFYRDTLGLQVSAQQEGIAFIRMPGLTLMLSAGLGKAHRPIAGAMELVFPVESVKAAYALLRQRGCTFMGEPREVTTGSWAATFTDPDAHKLTLFGPR